MDISALIQNLEYLFVEGRKPAPDGTKSVHGGRKVIKTGGRWRAIKGDETRGSEGEAKVRNVSADTKTLAKEAQRAREVSRTGTRFVAHSAVRDARRHAEEAGMKAKQAKTLAKEVGGYEHSSSTKKAKKHARDAAIHQKLAASAAKEAEQLYSKRFGKFDPKGIVARYPTE